MLRVGICLCQVSLLYSHPFRWLCVSNTSCCHLAWDLMMKQLWKEILRTIEGLVLPPLSDDPTELRRLTPVEMEVAIIWLQHLMEKMNGEGDGLPKELLQNSKYQGMFLAWDRMNVRIPTRQPNSTDDCSHVLELGYKRATRRHYQNM